MEKDESNTSQINNDTNIETYNGTNNESILPSSSSTSLSPNNSNINNITEEINAPNIKIKQNKSYLSIVIIFLIDLLMVVGPSFSYFLQAQKFIKTKSSKGFSKSICLILFLANILRVFFWIGKPFRVTLLLQSVLIIVSQVILIHLWVKYHDKKEEKQVQYVAKLDNNQQNEVFNTIQDKKECIEYLIDWSDTVNISKIWNWRSEFEYYKFMFIIILFLLLVSGLIGIHNPVLSNFFGTISVIFEAITCAPQLITNFQTKNTKNVSAPMIILWLIGDTSKMIYNIIYKTPIQMIISGAVQVILDIFVIIQVYIYKGPNQIFGVNNINKFMKNLDKSDTDKSNQVINNKGNISVGDNVALSHEKENQDKIEVLDKSEDNKVREMVENNNVKKNQIKNGENINNDTKDEKNGNSIEIKNNEESQNGNKMADDAHNS